MSRFFFFFFSFACGCPAISGPLVEGTILLNCIAFAHLSKISWLYRGLFLGTLVYSTYLFFFFFPHKYHTVVITAVLLLVLKLGSIDPPTLIFPFNTVLVVLGLLPFLINFRNQFVSFHKMTWWSFGWDCTILQISLGRTDILTLLSLPIHEHGIYLHLFSSLI